MKDTELIPDPIFSTNITQKPNHLKSKLQGKVKTDTHISSANTFKGKMRIFFFKVSTIPGKDFNISFGDIDLLVFLEINQEA